MTDIITLNGTGEVTFNSASNMNYFYIKLDAEVQFKIKINADSDTTEYKFPIGIKGSNHCLDSNIMINENNQVNKGWLLSEPNGTFELDYGENELTEFIQSIVIVPLATGATKATINYTTEEDIKSNDSNLVLSAEPTTVAPI